MTFDVVADLGGTSLRIARMERGAAAVTDARRMPTDGLGRHPHADAGELQRRVVAQLIGELGAYLGSPAGAGADAVGLSFAGPMSADGLALAAPTVWGAGGAPLAVGPVLEAALGLPVLVANDITAAAWRYADAEPEPFCLFTISSGIGCKVLRHGEVLVDAGGYGGELGHWRVDPAATAPRCDCGGRGHLGGIASGRGVLAAARRAAAERPGDFAGSALWAGAGGRPEQIANEDLAAAIRAGDPFATGVLEAALRPLAAAVGAVFAAIGVRRYLFIGGFAVAVGPRFIEVLGDQLVRAGCFGLTAAQIRAMLALGAADDDHSLIGMGRLLAHRLPARTAGVAG
ncbi:ROK family protein [Dactylosporangium sp. CA-139114]|uniref:ROK family protein n=1 Tax=Dactylosporangium sp. CA-139114 TaxID=3239931 RepID=UPI003D957657